MKPSDAAASSPSASCVRITSCPTCVAWQLIAYCEMRQSILMFKIDRIQQAVLLANSCTIAEDFNLDEYLGAAWGVIRGDGHEAENVVLRFEAGRGVIVWPRRTGTPARWPKNCRMALCSSCYKIAVTPEFANWLLEQWSL